MAHVDTARISSSRRSKRRRTQAERSATTRRALTEAATECLAELGYAGATVEIIAAKANVSRGAVQHHFGSREELLVEIVNEVGAQLMAPYEIPEKMTIPQRVDAAVDKSWMVLRSPMFLAVMQVWLSMQSNEKLFSHISRSVAKIETYLDTYWAQLFADTGIPKKKIAVLRHLVYSTLRGLAIRSIYRKEVVPWHEEIKMLKELTVHALR